MEILMKSAGEQEKIILSLSRAELLLLAGCVNETLEAVEDWEFSTRLGAEKTEVERLGADLRTAIQELPENKI
jgi:hypothetical protein